LEKRLINAGPYANEITARPNFQQDQENSNKNYFLYPAIQHTDP